MGLVHHCARSCMSNISLQNNCHGNYSAVNMDEVHMLSDQCQQNVKAGLSWWWCSLMFNVAAPSVQHRNHMELNHIPKKKPTARAFRAFRAFRAASVCSRSEAESGSPLVCYHSYHISWGSTARREPRCLIPLLTWLLVLTCCPSSSCQHFGATLSPLSSQCGSWTCW